MWRYVNFQADCSQEGGIIKIRSQPAHGKLSQQVAPVFLGRPRFSETSACRGKAGNGLILFYTADVGFSGTDTFTMEVSYPRHQTVIDTFTVHVH
jgi:hypothetical protein